MKKKLVVAYLCTPYVPKSSFNNFLKNYLHYKAGIKHKLLICYKNFHIDQLDYFRNKADKTEEIVQLLRCKEENIVNDVSNLQNQIKSLTKINEQCKNELLLLRLEEISVNDNKILLLKLAGNDGKFDNDFDLETMTQITTDHIGWDNPVGC